MAFLFALLAIQTVAALLAGVWFWRRLERQQAEIAELREAVAAKSARRTVFANARGATAEIIPLAVSVEPEPAPTQRSHRSWTTSPAIKLPTLGISAETARGMALALLAIAPAMGFAFSANPGAIVACGIAVGAAMIAIAHRPAWGAAAWAAIATSGVWASIGLTLGSAHTDPTGYSICVALAAVMGLAHAYHHRISAGIAMTLMMTMAVLALSLQIGMASPAGVAFGLIVTSAAIAGAIGLRLEGVHFGAFGAALLGLFALSGQTSAAIWFTPAAAWAGSIFFAIAAVRVPQLGGRGLSLAGTGAVAPLMSIAALHLSQSGLANHYAAAAVFAVMSVLLICLIVAAALRRERGLVGLKATLWVLSAGVFSAFAAAVALALPATVAAPTFALAALALSSIDLDLPSRVWRAFACLCGLSATIFAVAAAHELLSESGEWPAFALIASGLVMSAALTGAAARAAKHRQARLSAGLLESVTIAMAVMAAHLALRVVYSGGALLLEPVSFAELGAHAAVWLIAAFVLRLRARYGIRRVRIVFANVMLVAALGTLLTATALWLTPFWAPRQSPTPFISRETLGFLVPGIVLLAHVWLWRTRAAALQTRLALASSALMLATFTTLEVARADGDAAWPGAIAGALLFAAAIGVNFVPGIVLGVNLPQRKSPSRSARQATH